MIQDRDKAITNILAEIVWADYGITYEDAYCEFEELIRQEKSAAYIQGVTDYAEALKREYACKYEMVQPMPGAEYVSLTEFIDTIKDTLIKRNKEV